MDHWVQVVGNGEILWSALVGWASVVVYARVPWWHTQLGRHLMAFMVIVTSVLTLSSIRVFADVGAWWFPVLRVAVFTGVPLVMTQRLWLLIKAQRNPERTDR